VSEKRVWLGLLPPDDPTKAEGLVTAALQSERLIDITSAPARWGGLMRGTDAKLSTFGGQEVENAMDANHAMTLIHAELVQTLSSIGRDYIDVLFLTVRNELKKHQIDGALKALGSAKSEGAIRQLGLYAESKDAAGVLQQGEFDIVMVPNNPLHPNLWNELQIDTTGDRPLLASCRTLNWGGGRAFSDDISLIQSQIATKAHFGNVLVGVRSAEEVKIAIDAEGAQPDPVVDRLLEEAAKRRSRHS